MRQSELLSMAEIRKWEEDTMPGINDTKKTKNDMSENQAEYLKTVKQLDNQELRKWIAELVFNSQTVIWADNAEIIDACKLIEGYILGK
jgi:DNA-directed RNA polymerase subunit F